MEKSITETMVGILEDPYMQGGSFETDGMLEFRGRTDACQLSRHIAVGAIPRGWGVDGVEHVRTDFNDVRSVAPHAPLRIEPKA